MPRLRADAGDTPPAAHRRAGSLFTTAAAVALAILAPGICSADRWYQDYEQAVELIDKGECSREAIRKLGAAQVDKKKPNMDARTVSTRTIEYLPYYQLARAHLACGEFDAARDYIAASRRWGVAPADRLAALEEEIDRQEAAAASGTAEPQVATQELATLVGQTSETIGLARSTAELVKARRGNIRFVEVFQRNSDRIQQASEDLRVAEEKLNDGTLRRDAATVKAAATAADRALEAYTAIQAELTAAERTMPTPTPFVQPTATRRAPPTARPEIRPTARPTPVLRQPAERQSAGVPEPLRRAAADFLKAQYEVVVNELQPYYITGKRPQAAAHLLRAAAQFALYCIDGRRDEDSLNQVRRDIRESHEIDPAVVPDPRFFSPEFIELFQATE